MLIDTHCHLTDARFQEDLPETLARAHESGVGAIIAIASSLPEADVVRALWSGVSGGGAPGAGSEASVGEPGSAGAARPAIWGTAGVHPHEAASGQPEFLERLREALAMDPRFVAIGECGLDYHYDFSPRGTQLEIFESQIGIAEETGLPLVVHCREAEEDMRSIVGQAGRAGVRGVLHCFPGDPELLDVALDAGWLVSFTGMITFRSFSGEEAVRRVPGDRYMLETDGPYLAPVPHRGKRNEPAWVARVRDRVAEIRGETPQQVERATTATAERFFGLDLGGA